MMWKLILILVLILATCLFGTVSPSETENGNPDFFDNKVINTSPDIWPSDRSVDVLSETTPLPRSDRQIQSDGEVSGMLGLKPDKIESNITLQVQQEGSSQNEQNYSQLNETGKGVTTDDTGFTESSSSMPGNSKNIEESNENADSTIISKLWSPVVSKHLTTRSFLGRTARIVTSPSSFETTSDKSLATGIENISRLNNFNAEKDERPIASSHDAASENLDTEMEATTIFGRSIGNIVSTPGLDKTFSGEKNSLFPVSTTTQKKFSGPKSLPDINGFKSFISAEDGFTSTEQIISKGDSSSGIDEEPVTRLTTLILKRTYVYPSAITPLKTSEITSEDAVYHTLSEQDFTEKSNSFSALSTGENVSISSELSSFDAKEINPSQPALNESSLLYSGGNVENNTFQHSHRSNNTRQIMEVSGESPLAENSTTPTPFYYDELPPLSEVYNLDVTTPYTLKTFEGTLNVSFPNDTELTTFDLPGDSELPPSEQLPNDTYKLIFIGKCHGDNILQQTFKALYSIMNTGLNANNSTKLTECKQVYEFKFTSNIASPDSLKDALSEIKEKLRPVHAKIVNYDSEIYEISHTSEEDSENLVIPKTLIYISTGATISLILFMIFVALCVRNKCKRSSTSIDLSDMPHLTLSIDDYKLSPIPRPSVSIRDNSRDFLYAYSNETYSRTRDDDAILSEHHFSKNAGKEFVAEMKTQKDNPLALEMQTFEARRGNNRQRSEMESHSAQEYATPNSWDGLNGRKRGIEHPAVGW